MYPLAKFLFFMGVMVNLVPLVRSALGGFPLFDDANMTAALVGASLCLLGLLVFGLANDDE